jgi:transcriptional regulator with XRE-family HTH domain
MARNRITISELPELLGKSQSYWSRRINGEVALDVEDLAALASLLKVPASKFWCAVRDLNPEPADITERHLVLVEAA